MTASQGIIHRSPPDFHDSRAVQTTAAPCTSTLPTREAQACWRASPGEQGHQVVHGRSGMVPAEPAVGPGQRGVGGEGPDVPDPEVQDGLVADGDVDTTPALDQDGDDGGQGHQGDGHGGHHRGPTPAVAGSVRRPVDGPAGAPRERWPEPGRRSTRNQVGEERGVRPRTACPFIRGDCRGGPVPGSIVSGGPIGVDVPAVSDSLSPNPWAELPGEPTARSVYSCLAST